MFRLKFKTSAPPKQSIAQPRKEPSIHQPDQLNNSAQRQNNHRHRRSRGIGLAIAETYAYRGASRVVLTGRNEATLKQVTGAINEEPDSASREHVYRVGDVADRQFWVELERVGESLSIPYGDIIFE
jgi:hypothetical protein